jgi:folate-dependent phosphoribosylglycinamide formyltransferase PurN
MAGIREENVLRQDKDSITGTNFASILQVCAEAKLVRKVEQVLSLRKHCRQLENATHGTIIALNKHFSALNLL